MTRMKPHCDLTCDFCGYNIDVLNIPGQCYRQYKLLSTQYYNSFHFAGYAMFWISGNWRKKWTDLYPDLLLQIERNPFLLKVMFTIFQKFSFNQIQKQISKSLDGKLVDFWSNPPSNPLGDLWNTYLLMVMRNRCRMQEGDKMLLAHCSLLTLSCIARWSGAGIPHFTSRPFSRPARAPLRLQRFLSVGESGRAPPREREGDTWPGGCNLSIARTRDTDTPVTNCQAECGSDLLWFFGKAFPFQLPKPGWRGRDTIITGISCAGHNSNTCGEHFQVTNILQWFLEKSQIILCKPQ